MAQTLIGVHQLEATDIVIGILLALAKTQEFKQNVYCVTGLMWE